MDQSLVRQVLAAAQLGEKKFIQEVIAKGKVGVVDEDETTPLMYAAASGREEVLRMLLDKECLISNHLEEVEDEVEEGNNRRRRRYIDLQNSYGWTALMQAASYGHSGSFMYLLQRGANVHVKNAWGASVLVMASQGGHFGIVNALLSRGAQVDTAQRVGEELLSSTLTPLMAAAQCGHVEVIRELLRGGANCEVKLNATKWTALLLACLNNQVSAIEVLLEAGACKEAKDMSGMTGIDLVTALAYKNAMVLLAGGKLTKNVSDAEFFDAVSKGNLRKIEGMLREKASLVQLEGKEGVTPLMVATNKGHKEVCEILLRSKTEVNTKDKKYGWTAIMHATHLKKYEIVELLGSYGADVNLKDSSGSTPYDVASKNGDVQMIKLLHAITLKRLEGNATPCVTYNDTDVPSSSSYSMDMPSNSVPQVYKGAPPSVMSPPAQAGPNIQKFVDLGELKSRLQNAYRTPAVDMASSGEEQLSFLPPANTRFPSKPSSKHASLSSPVMSPSPSPSSSTDRATLGARRHLSSSAKPAPLFLSPQNSSRQLPSNRGAHAKLPHSPMKKMTLPIDERVPVRPSRLGCGSGDGWRGKGPRTKDTGSSRAGSPFNFSPRIGTPTKGRLTPKNRSESSGSHNTGSGLERRGLKSVLTGVSLLHYLPLFEAQEMDEETFWKLCEQDLAEMGISSVEDRTRFVSLISSHQTSQNTGKTSAGGTKSSPSERFTFQ